MYWKVNQSGKLGIARELGELVHRHVRSAQNDIRIKPVVYLVQIALRPLQHLEAPHEIKSAVPMRTFEFAMLREDAVAAIDAGFLVGREQPLTRNC